jgi:hypothetical protein
MGYGTWIRPESLQATLIYLAQLAGDELDPDVLSGLQVALEATNDEKDQWTDISLRGCYQVDLRFARDAESPIVLHVRATASAAIEREVETTLSLAGCFLITEPRE